MVKIPNGNAVRFLADGVAGRARKRSIAVIQKDCNRTLGSGDNEIGMSVAVHIRGGDRIRAGSSSVAGWCPQIPLTIARENHDATAFGIGYRHVQEAVPVEIGNHRLSGFYTHFVSSGAGELSITAAQKNCHAADRSRRGVNCYKVHVAVAVQITGCQRDWAAGSRKCEDCLKSSVPLVQQNHSMTVVVIGYCQIRSAVMVEVSRHCPHGKSWRRTRLVINRWLELLRQRAAGD